jgi:NADPH:quinone reductase-like Zn-dependent oxidoreductase
MKAYVSRSYGSPDHLDFTDVPMPVPADNEVLVRVRATSVNPYDWHNMRGEPRIARLMPGGLGLRTPTIDILGGDLAGQVESVGKNVTEFRPSDDVFALVPGGGFGEYVAVPETLLARKPVNLSYEQAAAVPMAGVTALLALNEGRIRSGSRVLINGASGGVGTFAVHIARALGATVTGVCGSGNVDLVRSIGADDVIDYRTQDFTRSAQRYDAIVDIAGGHSVLACRRVLTRNGSLVVVGGPPGRWVQPAGHVMAALAMAPFVSERIVTADTISFTEKKQSLVTLTEFIEAGQVAPVIDRTYGFDEIPAAITYQEAGHVAGKVVVTI